MLLLDDGYRIVLPRGNLYISYLNIDQAACFSTAFLSYTVDGFVRPLNFAMGFILELIKPLKYIDH